MKHLSCNIAALVMLLLFHVEFTKKSKYIFKARCQLTFTCSNSTMRTPEQHVEFVKNNYKGTSTTSMTSLWYDINDVAMVRHQWRRSGTTSMTSLWSNITDVTRVSWLLTFNRLHTFLLFLLLSLNKYAPAIISKYYHCDHCAKCNGDYV